MKKRKRQRKQKKEKAKKEKAEKKEDTKDSKKKTNQNENAKKDSTEVNPLTFDLENRFDRIVRLTVNSSRLGDAVMSPKGDILYYLAAFEGDYDLWEHKLKENTTKNIIERSWRRLTHTG